MRLRTLLTAAAAACGVFYLITTFPGTGIDLAQVNGGWLSLAFVVAVLSHGAAAMCLIGFVPERLPFGRVVVAQLAGSFVKAVTPTALGGVALTTRFLQKAGVPSAQALASVAVSQLAGAICRVLLLVTFGSLSGFAWLRSLGQSPVLRIGLPAAVLLVLGVTAVPLSRRWVVRRAREFLAGVGPRLLELLRRPLGPALGFAGYLLVTAGFVGCLDASLRAFGAGVGIVTVTVVYLTAHAVGSAVPTPGGVGAMEAALLGALLTLTHVSVAVATPAVLLYRLLMFWLPVLPGWLSFGYLQRKGAV
ncbi:YbhN family protein [Streptomyces sp. NPDC007856]|uniref:lysylphosphatidylglycerol synthase transmembrane domain-containing protein n=1 Tax=Streptomyces sp. NPDC007856 TaxID=3364781 RepID=UPI0036B916DD